MRSVRIESVEVHVLRGPTPERPPRLQRQVNAAAVYPEFSARRGGTPSSPSITCRYLRIGTSAGIEGLYGPIDAEVTDPLLRQLRPVLLGRDALAVEQIWDLLDRVDRHARHGALKMAISAIDNALWDIRGKVFDSPVWQLLGGGLRNTIPAYASMLGTPLDSGTVADRADWAKSEGFAGQKWFLADGPADGPDGLARNVQVLQDVRDAVGNDCDVMIDVFRGWDLAYAKAWTRRVEELRPTWLEEPFLPSLYPAFVALQRSTNIPLSAGEHLYDRADALPYLRDGILGALQSDPEWCGGVTELVRICALAESFGVPAIPHGHGLHAALHVVASRSPAVCPKVEYLVLSMPGRHCFEIDPPTPRNGQFNLPHEPGFGITLDESHIDERTVLSTA